MATFGGVWTSGSAPEGQWFEGGCHCFGGVLGLGLDGVSIVKKESDLFWEETRVSLSSYIYLSDVVLSHETGSKSYRI